MSYSYRPQDFTRSVQEALFQGDQRKASWIINNFEACYAGDPLYDSRRVVMARRWQSEVQYFISLTESLDNAVYDLLELSDCSGTSLENFENPHPLEKACPGFFLHSEPEVGHGHSLDANLTLTDSELTRKGFLNTLPVNDSDRYRIAKKVRFCNIDKRGATCFDDQQKLYNKRSSGYLCRLTKFNAAKLPQASMPSAYILPFPYSIHNYYHVTAEMIYGLRHVSLIDSCVPIVFQDDFFNLIEFYSAHLNIDKGRFLRLSDVDDCIIESAFIPDVASHYWNTSMVGFFREVAGRAAISSNQCTKRFYISRSLASRRPPREKELESMLSNHGFLIVHLERISVFEQALLFSQAEIIIGPHGAGLTNILFCEMGSLVIELFSPEFVTPEFFFRARVANLRYGMAVTDDAGDYIEVVRQLIDCDGLL